MLMLLGGYRPRSEGKRKNANSDSIDHSWILLREVAQM